MTRFGSPGSSTARIRAKAWCQAFRRHNSFYESARFKLSGLAPEGRYQVTDLGATAPTEIAGRELIENGVQISLPEKPSAATLIYQRIKSTR